MSKYRKLSHTFYKCDYHLVWTPKYRYRILEGELSSFLHREIYGLSSMKGVEIDELNIQSDHVHVLCSIPPKLSVSSYMGFLKGKTAIKVLGSYPAFKKSLIGGIIFGHEVILPVQWVLMRT